MLENAILNFVATHAAVLNERVHHLFEYGPACEAALKSHEPEVHDRRRRLESLIAATENRMKDLVGLMTAAKGVVAMMKNVTPGRGFPVPPNFPQLRMRIPQTTHLILSMVGNEGRHISEQDQLLLLAFGEFNQSLQIWKEALS
jgi:hypothetical protein